MGGSGSSDPNFGRSSGATGREASDGDGDGAGMRGDVCGIIEITILASPKPKVLANLKVGDDLYLRLNNNSPPVLAMTVNNEIAGTVIVRSLADLVQCISEGNSYVATVLNLDGGVCEIEVRLEGS